MNIQSKIPETCSNNKGVQFPVKVLQLPVKVLQLPVKFL